MERAIGHYNLLEKLGEGGLGEVFRARDTNAGRTVALELLPPPQDRTAREALLDDARAAATLSHPNIATLWDIGEDAGTHYLAYEFVAGTMLTQEIGGQPVHPRRAVELAVQMADALAEAHARGLIHGDIRPDAVAVTQKGSAKLLDFGMSRWTRGGSIRSRAAADPASLGPDAQSVVGYLSPEQALGGLVDVRTDVFSLGIVLYEMLTGRNPFLDPSPESTIVAVIGTAPPPPSSINPHVPPDLDRTVLRALAKDIDARQQSAASLSADLRSVGLVLDVRKGDTAAKELMPLDEEENRAGTYALLTLVFVTVAGATWWLLS